jgi:hypothetical protein
MCKYFALGFEICSFVLDSHIMKLFNKFQHYNPFNKLVTFWLMDWLGNKKFETNIGKVDTQQMSTLQSNKLVTFVLMELQIWNLKPSSESSTNFNTAI